MSVIARFAAVFIGASIALGVEAQPQRWLNQYGQVGLMQTPTARGFRGGTFGLGAGVFSPYRTIYFFAQPLDWLQGTFRFAEVTNRDYSFVGSIPIENQPGAVRRHFTDKGTDLQVRLWEESRHIPQVAIGLMDFAGTGIFSADYIVASRRFFNFDFHFGVGWGRLGSADDFRNPLSAFSESFRNRSDELSGLGGEPEVDSYFRGDTAFFGGVSWTPDGGPLTLFLELEGNDYQDEALQNPQESDSRWNIGASYRLADLVDLGVGWQRGNTVAAQLSVVGDLGNSDGPEKTLQPRVATVPAYTSMRRNPLYQEVDSATVQRIRRDMRSQGLRLHGLDADEATATLEVWYSQSLTSSVPMAAGRTARALIRRTGVAYDQYELIEVIAGMESSRVIVSRDMMHRAISGGADIESFADSVEVRSSRSESYGEASYRDLLRYPVLNTAINPQTRANLGGPDARVVGQVLARLSATAQLSAGWSVRGALGINVIDNISDGRLRQKFPSGLPTVRSNVGDYLREGRDVYLAQLEANYLFPVARDLYGRVSAGIFEEMFGGVAAELLYRPAQSEWALSVELARLRQREFEQRFGFQDYETTTAFLTYYQELPWYDLRLKLTAGRYLAQDQGLTFDISRQFANGVRFGVFATPTDASTEDFGEGSFDKGFYLSIPVDLFSPRGGRGDAELTFRPLSRDGGQRAATGRALYPALEISDPRGLKHRPAQEWLQ